MSNDLGNALRRAATFGLDHVRSRPQVDWADVDADHLWRRASHDRMTGLLIADLRAGEHDGSVPDALVERLEPRAIERVGLLTELEWHLVELVELLRSSGVTAAAVKGPTLGRSMYPEHWWRDFGDLDLLVPASEFAPALGALESAGTGVIAAPVSRRAATLLGKGVTMRHARGFEIDLHHTLLSGSLGLDLDWAWWMDHGTTVDVGGGHIATTGPVRTALHLLAHLCIGGPDASLHVARDVAQSLNGIDPSGPNGARLVASVTDIGLDGLVQAGVSLVGGELGWRHAGWIEWSQRHPTPPRWHEVRRRFAREQRSFGAVVAASLRMHTRPGDRLTILGATAWPDTAHLADRGLSRWGYLAHLGRSMRDQRATPNHAVPDGLRPAQDDTVSNSPSATS
jgi:hypothetical protein